MKKDASIYLKWQNNAPLEKKMLWDYWPCKDKVMNKAVLSLTRKFGG